MVYEQINKNQFMIVIAGATGVGKTDFALSLAEYLPIEIINADLGQFYQPLTIGTAKPLWQEHPVKHHLFDIFSEPRSCTVMEYRTRALECIHKIWQQKKIPVIVGGSTLYVESIFFEPQQTKTNAEFILNEKISESWDQLNAFDPERAAKIHPNDSYRIKRALAIWQTTGVKPSEQKPIYNPPVDYWFFYLTRDRNDLYKRINERVGLMIDAGWLDEVRSLINTDWQSFIQAKKFIGYPELVDFQIKTLNSYENVLALISQRTRNYAKRQETYFKRLEKKLYNCLVKSTGYTSKQASKIFVNNLTSLDLTVYIKQLSKNLLHRSESRDYESQ
jgi:tRNA dimethylallyltransferase